MNREYLRGNWNELKGRVRRQWGKLTDDDLDMVKGDQEILIGKIQQHYGRSRDEAEREVREWLSGEDRGYDRP
jgi:uncharacterized protein YjbJ (UPF0337 family)